LAEAPPGSPDEPQALRIAFSSEAPNGVAVDEPCRDAVLKLVDLCADLGHIVEEAAPDFDIEVADRAFLDLTCDDAAFLVRFWTSLRGRIPEENELEPYTRALVERGERRTAAEHLLDVSILEREAQNIARFFSDFDLWVTPTQAQPPLPIGALQGPAENPLAALAREAEFEPFAWIASFTGQPAISLPVGMLADTLPVGVHVMARSHEEGSLIELATQIERRIQWESVWPKLAHGGGAHSV
jgi:amidase